MPTPNCCGTALRAIDHVVALRRFPEADTMRADPARCPDDGAGSGRGLELDARRLLAVSRRLGWRAQVDAVAAWLDARLASGRCA
jgi:hypothetical protein